MINKYLLLSAIIIFTNYIAGAQHTGIGVPDPGTTLDVGGAITNREVTLAPSSANAAVIPANVSQVVVRGSGTIQTATLPPIGQRLTIHNRAGGNASAVLNGHFINNGQMMDLIYTAGGYVPVSYTSIPQWGLSGNTGTNPLSNYLGTANTAPLVFKTAGQERMRIAPNGQVGLDTIIAGNALSVKGSLQANQEIIATGDINSDSLLYADRNLAVDAANKGNGTAGPGTLRFPRNMTIGSQRNSNAGFYNSLIFHTASGPQMAIDNGGYVYVGDLNGIDQAAPGLAQTNYQLSTNSGDIIASDVYSAGGIEVGSLNQNANVNTIRTTISRQYFEYYANLPVGTNNRTYTWTHNGIAYPKLMCSVERVSGSTEISVCYKHTGPYTTNIIIAKGEPIRSVSGTAKWTIVN